MASLNLRKFCDPDFLNSVEPAHLQSFLAPWTEYLEKRGLGGALPGQIFNETFASILLAPTSELPTDMIDALYYVHETASTEDMDAFLEKNASIGLGLDRNIFSTPADVAVQVWIKAPDVVRERHAENIAFRQKTFAYYGGLHDNDKPFPVVSEPLRIQIEAALDDWFEAHRRGRGSRIFFFPQGRKVWILVRHGLPVRREASHQEDGQSSIAVYRPQQHDVLVYDRKSDELAVHAGTQGEKNLYCTCIGKYLFGDEAYFPAADKFSLDPLRQQGGQSLLCEDVVGLESIRLTEYRRYWGGPCKEVEIRRASDIFAALTARAQDLARGGALTSGSFKIKFADSPKERSVTIRPPGFAKYERDADSGLIEQWLARRGFISEETDTDDEAPIKVLEGV